MSAASIICWKRKLVGFFGALLLGAAPLTPELAPTAAQVRTATMDGSTIAYATVSGGGVPIVLLHGWASDSAVWNLLLPRLRWMGPLFAVDAPGSGFSPPGQSPFSYRRYADAAEAVLTQEYQGSAIIVAHSFGAYAAREFARAYAGRTCAIVLLDGSFNAAFADEAAVQNFIAGLAGQTWPRPLEARDRPAEASEETLRLLPAMHHRASRESAIAWVEALRDRRLFGSDRVSVPVLMIIRAGSTWVTDEHLARLRSIAPHLQVRRLGNISHFVAWDAPDEVATMIREFAQTIRCGRIER